MFKKKIATALTLLWAATLQTTASPLILESPQDYEVYCISPNGKWACGGYSDYSYNYYGFRWNLETNEVELLSSKEESLAWSIADDGTVAGTFQDRQVLANGNPVEMAGYYKDGAWHHLEVPEGAEGGQGFGISTDGHYMSGSVSINGVYAAVIWKDGKIYRNYADGLDAIPWAISPDGQMMAGWAYPTSYGNRRSILWNTNGEKVWLNDCEAAWCGAQNFSPDGKKIVFWGGYRSYNETDVPQVASIYDVATGEIGYITTPGETGIQVYDITNSGMVLGGEEFYGDGFFWKDNEYITAVQYLTDRGVSFDDIDIYCDSTANNKPYIFRAASISEDESRIALLYYDTEGAVRSMIVMLDAENGEMAPISVTATQMQDIEAVKVSWKQSVLGSAPDGYNIYRNGTKLNNTPLTTTTYYDPVGAAGTYSYEVSALYGETEKKANAVSVDVTEKTISAPQSLFARQKGINGARLQWTAPASNFINRTYYDVENAELSGFGTNGTLTTFETAIMFDKDEIALYKGNKLRKVQFYPMDANATGWKVTIYTRDDNGNLSQVYTQAITQELTINALNTVTLTTPVTLPDGDLIVAIGTQGSTSAILGMDYGTVTAGHSDLVRQASESDFYSMKTASGGGYLITWYINALLGPDSAADNADELDHYNVYADGQSQGTTKSLSYTLGALADGNHTLGVSATFADGKTSAITTSDVTVTTQGVDDLTATINGETAVDLKWTAPSNDDATYVTYASGEAKTGPKGTSDNNYGLMAAAIYDKNKLKGYDGYSVKSFRFYPTADALFTVIVLKAGEQIYEQEVDDYTLNQWNIIDVTTPITIDENSEYQLVVDCYDVTPEEAPLAIDGYAPYKNYSDLYSLDGESWASLTETGLNCNWMMGWDLYDPTATTVGVAGYDLYVDGTKANTDKLTATTYTHNFGVADTQQHTARVDVYYASATESVEGNTVTFTLPGLTGINAANTEKLTLRYGENFLTIDGGAQSIEAFNASGAKVATTTSDKLNITGFAPGIYVVKAKTAQGTLTRKIEVSK